MSSFNTSSHCLLASMVSDEKWAVNLTKNTLHKMRYFSHFQDSLWKMSFMCNSLIIMFLGVYFFEFILFEVYSAPSIWRNLSFLPLFLQIFFFFLYFLPLEFHHAYVLGTLQVSKALFVFIHSFFFLFLRLDNLNYLFSNLLSLLLPQMCCWAPLVNF